jgi:hypothetical protein
VIRIQIKLTEDDFRRLRHLADIEFRDLRQQAGILIREGLENRELSNNGSSKDQSNQKTLGVSNG